VTTIIQPQLLQCHCIQKSTVHATSPEGIIYSLYVNHVGDAS